MTDDPRRDGIAPGGFDDDRLLALALGLDDDPELVAAAADDEVLRRRLETMRGEVGGIGAQVRAAVPAPDEGYADPADPRWSGLRELFATENPQPAPVRRREGRWLRMVAPAAAVIVALVVGISVLDRGGGTASLKSDTAAIQTPAPAPSVGDAERSLGLSDQIDQFALVVLARARAAQGAVQRFAVVRVLKGTAPDVLSLHITDGAAPAGRLHVLLLRPLATTDGQALVGGPTTTKSADDFGAGRPVAYTYGGEPAVARELPPGTDPASITLP